MHSKVTLNSDLLKIGDILVYSDASNYSRFKVTWISEDRSSIEVSEVGFNLSHNHLFDVNELQIGWGFSSDTLEKKIENALDSNDQAMFERLIEIQESL